MGIINDSFIAQFGGGDLFCSHPNSIVPLFLHSEMGEKVCNRKGQDPFSEIIFCLQGETWIQGIICEKYI
jgi:hypothetical protein